MPRGNKIEISMSNTRKIIAIKKNRIEKGIRDVFFGSKPHSKGELFSWSKSLFLDNRDETINSSLLNPAARANLRINK